MSGTQIASSFPSENALWRIASGAGTQELQKNALFNQGAQQDLTDRATLRGLAPGLAANDPNAYAGAAVLPGGPVGIAALTGRGDLGIRQQQLDLQLQLIKAARAQSQATIDANDPNGPQSQSGPLPGQGGPSDAFEKQMGESEAPNASTVNKGGYIGQHQFGAARLADLGMYQPAQGEDVKANKWTGTFDIPGFPNVKTKADFLTGPDAAAAQHAVFKSHVGNIDTAIAQTPGAAAFDANGLRAVAHLGGNEGMRKFVASGGHYDPADSNGTKLSDYYLKFGAGGPAALQTAFGAPHGPAGPPPTPAPYQVAGPTVAPPDAAPGADRAGGADLVGPRPLPPTGAGAPVVTPQSLANTPVNGLAAPAPPAVQPAPVAPPAPVQTAQAAPQPGAVPGQPPGAFPPPTMKAGADTPPPPVPVLANGLTPAQWAEVKAAQSTVQTFADAQAVAAKVEAYKNANRAQAEQYFTLTHPTTRSSFGPLTTDPTTGKVGYPVMQGQNQVGFYPAAERPAGGSYDIAKASLEADRPKIDAIAQAGQTSQAGMLRLNEMADIIPRLATGPAGELKTKGAAWLESLGASPETIKRYTGMESGSLAEELIKLSIATVGQAAKSDIGSNVGIQSLQLYQSSNPGMALLPGANMKMTNMLRVATQLSQDYTNGALEHFNPQQAALMRGGTSYVPISEYNQQWQQRNNPQIAAAAMGILNGDQFSKWSARVSPEEATAATGMAARIDPNVKVPTRTGIPVPARDILAHPALPTPP